MHRLGFSVGFGLVLALFLNILAPPPALAVSCGKNKSHNAFFGSRRPGDTLLHMDHPKVSYKLMRVVTYDVVYPSRSDIRGNITYIEIYDQFKDGNGGCAFIFNGGIGSDHVGIHLKSQRNHGLDFVVRIYGTRRWR